MEVVRVSSGLLAQTLSVVDAAIHPPSHEDAARLVADELAYLLRLARSRRRPGPAVYLFACPDRQERE